MQMDEVQLCRYIVVKPLVGGYWRRFCVTANFLVKNCKTTFKHFSMSDQAIVSFTYA